jgi:hypothetical protein
MSVCFLVLDRPVQPPANESHAMKTAEAANIADAASPGDPIASIELPAAESIEEGTGFQGSWSRELRKLKELAALDPDAAIAGVMQLSDKEEREAAARAVCLELGRNNPELAMAAAWHFQLGKNGGLAESAALESLAKEWASSDLTNALAWVSEQPRDEEGQRDRIVKSVATVWSERAPAEAAKLVAEQMTPGFAQFEAAMIVVRQWSLIDYPAAAAWTEIFPEPARVRAREELSKTSSTEAGALLKPSPLQQNSIE